MENEQQLIKNSIENVIKFYSNMVYRLAYARMGTKYDADEIYQEVFLRYIKKQPIFESEEHRKAWFIRVTINCANSWWTSKFKRKTEPLDEAIPLDTKEDIDLYNELQQLPPNYREIIHLFYYEDMSVEEISLTLNRKKSTVRTQLTRARTLLKDILREDYHAKRTI